MTYRRALFLADALRRADLDVREVSGWQTRGRPPEIGSFDPRALMLHHDASARGRSPGVLGMLEQGRPGIPGPLSQLWESFGTWYVVASGRANHAGVGDGWGRIPRDLGNTYAIGVETDHTTGEPWAEGEVGILARGFAALSVVMAIEPSEALSLHREYAPDRKIDAAGINGDRFRGRVAAQMVELRAAWNRPRPVVLRKLDVVDLSDVRRAALHDPSTPGVEGTEGARRDVFTVEKWLHAEGLLDRKPNGSYDDATVEAYRRFEKRVLGFEHPDGIPGLVGLTKLARRHDGGVRR